MSDAGINHCSYQELEEESPNHPPLTHLTATATEEP